MGFPGHVALWKSIQFIPASPLLLKTYNSHPYLRHFGENQTTVTQFPNLLCVLVVLPLLLHLNHFAFQTATQRFRFPTPHSPTSVAPTYMGETWPDHPSRLRCTDRPDFSAFRAPHRSCPQHVQNSASLHHQIRWGFRLYLLTHTLERELIP